MSAWPIVRLEEVAKIERTGVAPEHIKSGTLYLGLEHIEAGGRILGAVAVQNGELASNKFSFSPNHILYGKLRPYLAKIAKPDFEGVCSTDILPVLPSETVDKGYLLHFLRQPAIVEMANSRAEGANLPRLSPKALAQFEIPLPPLEEQKRIAAILDQADSLRRLRQRSLDRLNTLSQAIFYEMFGDVRTNSMGWPDNAVLGDLADIVSGITKGRKFGNEPVREIPYLAVANVQDKHLKLDAVKAIEATEKEIERFKLQKNDLLLTEGGDPDKLGRGTLWDNELEEAIHQNHVFRVRITDSRILPVFLNWLVGSQRGKSYFLNAAKQTTGIASINMGQLRRFPMLLPPVELQAQFSARIADLAKILKTVSSAKDTEDNLFASLQHRAFRGEL